jgi:hypothetical protein
LAGSAQRPFADDPDVLLELPGVMAGIYTRAAYARRIDYNQPVPPPSLRSVIQDWLTANKSGSTPH